MSLDPGSVICKIMATGELLCRQVQPDGWFATVLSKWTDILTAVVTTALSISAAWLLSRVVLRREQRTYAYLLLPTLKKYENSNAQLALDLGSTYPKTTHDAVRQIKTLNSNYVSLYGPEARPLFIVDWRVRVHLELANKAQGDLAEQIAGYESAVVQRDKAEGKRMEMDEMVRDMANTNSRLNKERLAAKVKYYAGEAEREWGLYVEHVALARYFLERLANTWQPVWVERCRQHLAHDDYIERSDYVFQHLAPRDSIPLTPPDVPPEQDHSKMI